MKKILNVLNALTVGVAPVLTTSCFMMNDKNITKFVDIKSINSSIVKLHNYFFITKYELKDILENNKDKQNQLKNTFNRLISWISYSYNGDEINAYNNLKNDVEIKWFINGNNEMLNEKSYIQLTLENIDENNYDNIYFKLYKNNTESDYITINLLNIKDKEDKSFDFNNKSINLYKVENCYQTLNFNIKNDLKNSIKNLWIFIRENKLINKNIIEYNKVENSILFQQVIMSFAKYMTNVLRINGNSSLKIIEQDEKIKFVFLRNEIESYIWNNQRKNFFDCISQLVLSFSDNNYYDVFTEDIFDDFQFLDNDQEINKIKKDDNEKI